MGLTASPIFIMSTDIVILNPNQQTQIHTRSYDSQEFIVTQAIIDNGIVLPTISVDIKSIQVSIKGGARQSYGASKDFYLENDNITLKLVGTFFVGQVLQVDWESNIVGDELGLSTEVQASFGVLESSTTFNLMCWLRRLGSVEASPTSISVSIKDQSDTEKVSMTSSAPNPSGVFHFSVPSTAFSDEGIYRAEVTIVHSSNNYIDFIPIGLMSKVSNVELRDEINAFDIEFPNIDADLKEIAGLCRKNTIIDNTHLAGKIVSSTFTTYKDAQLDAIPNNILHVYTTTSEYDAQGLRKHSKIKVS